MDKYPLKRNYMVGWYTLRKEDAVNGLKEYLSKRKGVKNICILSCIPSQLEGDKGYKMHVSYDEYLDETFNFSENLDKVIFLNCDSPVIPYNVGQIAFETGAGIVLTNPSLKDAFYDVGDFIPFHLLDLIKDSKRKGISIVGITPSTSKMQDRDLSSSYIMEYTINSYLLAHPSIKNCIIINNEDIKEFSSNVFIGEDIPLGEEEKAKKILNGKGVKKKLDYFTKER